MRLHLHHWFIIVVGGWLIVSPWVLGFYKLNLAAWNAIIVGVVIVLFALWDALSRAEKEED